MQILDNVTSNIIKYANPAVSVKISKAAFIQVRSRNTLEDIDEKVPEQSRHLEDEEKCAMTIHRYGEITGKYVIYRGKTSDLNDIHYVNVEEYLKAL